MALRKVAQELFPAPNLGLLLTVCFQSVILSCSQLIGSEMSRAQHIARASRKATYQDVLDAPPHMVAEVVAGTLHMQPRLAKRHAWASSVMGIEIGAPFGRGKGGPGGWAILFEPELHLGEDIVVPDIAGWRRDTMSEDMDGEYFTQAPDWVCEVLSPSTRGFDKGKKRAIYSREKVAHLWFLDPDAQTLEAFELRNALWVLLATLVDDAPVSLPPFDAISFPLSVLWPEVVATVVGECEDS